MRITQPYHYPSHVLKLKKKIVETFLNELKLYKHNFNSKIKTILLKK